MKKTSLKLELLIDLSLLTFCALVLSSGILIILIRGFLPTEIESLAEGYIEKVNTEFLGSPQIQELKRSKSEIEPQELRSAFQAYRGEEYGDLRDLEFNAALGAQPEPQLHGIFKNSIFFLPVLEEYEYTTPFSDEIVLSYRWSFRPIHQLLDKQKKRVFLIALLIAIILVFIGYHLLFRKNILVPIRNLSDTANAFLDENWLARCKVNRRDELGQIAEALNEMAGKIQEKEKKLVLSIQSLQKANEEIEASKNEQLQIEKLASVGRLAAGVAHEVGNPLGAISGYIDILRRTIQTPEKISPEDVELCDRIESETNRISKIIRALLQQAKPPQDRIKPVEVRPLMKKAVELAVIPSEVEVEFDFDDDTAAGLCEKDQLLQVCLNLLINAKHAIESKYQGRAGGKIQIRCADRRLPVYEDESSRTTLGGDVFDTSVVRALKPQTYLMIRISDNGTGISDDDKSKLFEPFFSTKETGKGTGLGLYVAKSIIESFRGAIALQSEHGHGTSFSIFLPKQP